MFGYHKLIQNNYVPFLLTTQKICFFKIFDDICIIVKHEKRIFTYSWVWKSAKGISIDDRSSIEFLWILSVQKNVIKKVQGNYMTFCGNAIPPRNREGRIGKRDETNKQIFINSERKYYKQIWSVYYAHIEISKSFTFRIYHYIN